MKRTMNMLMGVLLGAALVLTVAANQSNDPAAAAEVIEITKAEWSAAMQKNVSESLRHTADECTIFEADLPTRLEGKGMIRRFAEGTNSGPGQFITAEMTNEKVQVYGDAAVLSYNFLGQRKDQDGVIHPILAKSTRVYIRDGNSWQLVHANFAPIVTPEG